MTCESTETLKSPYDRLEKPTDTILEWVMTSISGQLKLRTYGKGLGRWHEERIKAFAELIGGEKHEGKSGYGIRLSQR